MRKRLMAAAAMAPLMLGYQAAHAQNPALTISSDTSTPVATATAVSGGPGDITLSSGATFTIKDTTPAFTLNSNNNVSNAGTITSDNVNGATGIQVPAGPAVSGIINNGGTISLSESYTPSDSANSDGIAEAPFAQGSGRIGINMLGPLTGQIINSGTITIQGNSSIGISIANTLTGPAGSTYLNNPALQAAGTITMVGDNSFGIKTTGEIAGGVSIGAGISMKGMNSVGVQTNAPIDGSLYISGTITTTGYATTTRASSTELTNIQKTPADVQQGGSALQIQGSVLGGVFLAAPPASTVSTDTTTDADGDGVTDSSEGSSSLTTYGSAPTIQIGGQSAITFGNFGGIVTNSSGVVTANNEVGLIIEGTVSAQGVWDGVSATAVDIGTYTDANGVVTHNGVNLNGGIRTAGTVSATAYQADATAIHLETGVTGIQLLNTGSITAAVTSAGSNTATALQIDKGSTLTALNNNYLIAATANGDQANATAVVDKGGGISSVINYGGITANLTPASPGEAVSGSAVAMDLHYNTSGISIQQLSNGTNNPAIIGDVLLGSGYNAVDLETGSMTGTLSFNPNGTNPANPAPGTLTINNGATYTGALLSPANGQLTINLANGVLYDKSPTTVGTAQLIVGGSSTLGVELDPANNRSTQFNVSGAATFAAGAKISATLMSTPSLSGETFTIVKAGSLSVGSTDTDLLGSLPYLFNGSLTSNIGAGTISLSIVTKTPAEMSFNKAETAAFNAIYAALPQDNQIQQSIIGAPDRKTLVTNYDQLLPSSAGDVFNTAFGMSRAVSRAASDRFDMSTQKDDEDEDDLIVSGFWASEFYSGQWQDKVDNNAWHSAGIGVIGGYDFGGTGFTVSGGSSNITVPGRPGDSLNAVSVVEGSFYASPRFGALSIDARVGAGYVNVANRRQLAATIVSGDLSSSSNITKSAKGDWWGYDFTGHIGAGWEVDASKHLFFQPKIYADVFHLHENGYTEHNQDSGDTGAGYDFTVAQRNSTQTNGTASLVTGLRFGNLFVVSPQLEIGYDKVLTGGPADTTARFTYGGPSFTVPANQIGGAAMGRLTIRGDGNYVHFSLQAGGEYSSSYHSLDAKAVFRLTF
jgi:hypothetical protein